MKLWNEFYTNFAQNFVILERKKIILPLRIASIYLIDCYKKYLFSIKSNAILYMTFQAYNALQGYPDSFQQQHVWETWQKGAEQQALPATPKRCKLVYKDMKTFEQYICPANIITKIPSVGWICMVATINGNVTNEAPLNNGKLLTALSKTVAKCGHFSSRLIRLMMGLGWRTEIAALP